MIQLHNYSGLQGMQEMSESSVDLVLTDPPYGIASKNKRSLKGNKLVSTDEAWGQDFQDSWPDMDAYLQWLAPFTQEMHRILKPGASAVLFLDKLYTGHIVHQLCKNQDWVYKNKMYFFKKNPVPGMCAQQYRSSVEEAVWLMKPGKCRTVWDLKTQQSEMKQYYEGTIGKKSTTHPCEKYPWMIRPMIANHSRPGDVIVDPFAGSSSTLWHARDMGRQAIGFELSEKFYDMSFKRLFGFSYQEIASNDESYKQQA